MNLYELIRNARDLIGVAPDMGSEYVRAMTELIATAIRATDPDEVRELVRSLLREEQPLSI